ncbi:hypothetical protein [Phocaeicola plebeius]|uniref:hypothetical protein n=1 Tax=Phocaeicola plebeius TaxID=310297 RepID=UPI0020122DC4|nr:hypothetical protein [Phocaeicola plebeius]MCL1614643.1 hypothetical protein [Phocaeicola plebeius]
MKFLNNSMIWSLILCAGLVVSCKDDDEPGIPGGLALDKTEIAIGPEGGTERVQVTSSTNWVSSVSAPWVSVSPANGFGSVASVLTVDSTFENTARTLEVRYTPQGQQPQTLTVTQFGFGKQILIKEAEVELESSANYDERVVDVTIQTNVQFRIDMDNIGYSFEEGDPTGDDAAEAETQRTGWIDLERNQSETPVGDDLLDRGARPRTVKVRFRWEMNTVPYTRVAKIDLLPLGLEGDETLVDADGNPIDKVTLTVTQTAAPKIEDNRAGDSLAIIMICEKAQTMVSYSSAENMRNWDGVTLWERTDEVDGEQVPSEWVGRVRSVSFMGPNIQEGESFPRELRYLKYLETLSIASNTNRQTREMHLGDELLELKHLKELSISSYGLIDLPEDFKKLGGEVDDSYAGLEALTLSSNNFENLSDFTGIITKENFPKLEYLDLSGCRRTDALSDLSTISGFEYNGTPIGLRSNISTNSNEKQALIDLLTWEKLRYLSLSYGFMQGSLPTDEEMVVALQEAGQKQYYDEYDFFAGKNPARDDWWNKVSKDTCQWLLSEKKVSITLNGEEITAKGTEIPRVLPFTRAFSINLNFLTGPLPKWLLFHPYLAEWNPGQMIFNQQEKGKTSEGVTVGFDGVGQSPYGFDYTYYYGNKQPAATTEEPGDWNPDKDPDYSDRDPGVAYPLYYYRYVNAAGANDPDYHGAGGNQ